MNKAGSKSDRTPAKPLGRKAVRKAQRATERSDDAHAFIPDPSEGGRPPSEDLAEILGEDFVQSVTRGTDALDDDLDATVTGEIGGPFVITKASDELASGIDESNPEDAEPAGLPTANAGLISRSAEQQLSEAESSREEDEP